MNVRFRGAGLILASSALAFGLLGCGSSGNKTSGSTATTAPSASSAPSGSTAGSAPTGTTLSVGVIETVTGGPGQTGRITAATDIMNAWAKQVNATGGILGHPVKVIAENDNADPAQAQSDLATLQADHVLAIVGEDASTTEPNWKATIDRDGLPVIGGTAYSANWFTDGLFYPGTTTVPSNVWAEVYAAKQAVASARIGSLLCSNSSVCQSAVALQKAAAQQLGVPIVYNQTADAAAASYTPQCLAMKEAGANVAEPQGINDVSMARDCHRQNFKPVIITENYDATPSQIQQNPSELAGMVGPAPAFPPFQEFPQTAGYFNLLKAYAPAYLPGGKQYGTSTLQAAVDAYVATQIFETAIKNANIPASQAVTRADLVKGLSMIQNDTLGGLSPPLTYGDGTKPNPQILCFYLYRTANTTAAFETIPPNTLKTYCQPATPGA